MKSPVTINLEMNSSLLQSSKGFLKLFYFVFLFHFLSFDLLLGFQKGCPGEAI